MRCKRARVETWKTALALMLVVLAQGSRSRANALTLRHDLDVELHLSARKLTGQDVLRIDHPGTKDLTLEMAPQARILSVFVDETPIQVVFQSGHLQVSLPPHGDETPVFLRIVYEAAFYDPPPTDPVNFDNPGFGVTGTITDKGAFLLPGSGWYPQIQGATASFSLTMTAPRGIYGVTAGKLVKHEDRGQQSISTWEIETPAEGIALSVGPYVVHSQMAGKTQLLTYFFPETDPLSQTYLKAAETHIQFYEDLLGPYPFPKFAVVENFFPTGYGFPSYTLLGTTVLRLPFIPETSLKHEIAHSWWGNGVLVDYDTGNWCEGLTTYVADYLSQEMVSAVNGEQYRQQILRDYGTLVATGGDFPLRQFESRVNSATRAVGYGKAAFVFHMVRKRLGDTLFWRSLRRMVEERMFKRTSWDDFRRIFVETGDWDLSEADRFFDQWLTRSGAPTLETKDVRCEKSATAWKVEGFISQSAPPYDLDVPFSIDTSPDGFSGMLRLTGPSSSFLFRVEQPPRKLIVDPHCNIFRMLYPEEIPVTVNSVKASKDLVAVISDDMPASSLETFKLLLDSLGQDHLRVLKERDVEPHQLKDTDVFIYGWPKSEQLRTLFASLPDGLSVAKDRFALQGVFSRADGDCLFASFRGIQKPRKVISLFLPLPETDPGSVNLAARKITHYGKYSYLVFAGGVNKAKGTWPITHSPLIVPLDAKP